MMVNRKSKIRSSNIVITATIGILIILVSLNLITVQNSVYNLKSKYVNSLRELISISTYVEKINSDTLYGINCLIQNNTDELNRTIDNINKDINSCENELTLFEAINLSDAEQNSYNQFKLNYISYIKNVESVIGCLETADTLTAISVYNQELLPVKNCTIEIIDNLVMINKKETDTKFYIVRLNIIIACCLFVVVGIVAIIIINVTYKKQSKLLLEVKEQDRTIMKQKTSLNTAVFKDVLTDANNRISLLNRFVDNKEELKCDEVMYFVLFNADNFDYININYGNNVGDIVLSDASARLLKIFGDDAVYRVGSDEFMVVLKKTYSSTVQDEVFSYVNKAVNEIHDSYIMDNKELKTTFSTSIVRKRGPYTLNTNIIEVAKDAMNKGRASGSNEIVYVDLDVTQM